jgi:DNA-binding NtrC family response regulator
MLLATHSACEIVGAMIDKRGSVLVVDDDAALGMVLAALLAQEGFSSEHVASGFEALRLLERQPFDAVLTDLRMPDMDGLALLKAIGQRWASVPVIMLTAHGSVPAAVEAMKAGAADFMLKPCSKEELVFVVGKALAATRRDRDRVPTAPIQGPEGVDLVGDSPVVRDLLVLIRKAAAGRATVLVHGETGTGKELVARALHEGGSRKAGPFVKVHCGALPDALLESELFGYEKGAFTGAGARKPGRVELAHKGTLFLDEIGDVTPAVQVKLLRVLQEREIERLGGTETIKVDVRFIAATHRDLEAMVVAGQFREDLFYRLNVVPIRVPPLRERAGDVERIARRFCATFGKANGRPHIEFEDASLALLASQPWPGNVRQLANLVERLVVLSDSNAIGPAEIERELGRRPLGIRSQGRQETNEDGSLLARRREAEKEALLHALARAGQNRTLAARLLDVSRRTLYNKLREHGVD